MIGSVGLFRLAYSFFSFFKARLAVIWRHHRTRLDRWKWTNGLTEDLTNGLHCYVDDHDLMKLFSLIDGLLHTDEGTNESHGLRSGKQSTKYANQMHIRTTLVGNKLRDEAMGKDIDQRNRK